MYRKAPLQLTLSGNGYDISKPTDDESAAGSSTDWRHIFQRSLTYGIANDTVAIDAIDASVAEVAVPASVY